MSHENKTAGDFLDADAKGCMGDVEADRLLKMLLFIEQTSPSEKRKKMLEIFAEEFSGTFLCAFHWHKVEEKLAEVVRICPVLQ